MLDASALMAVLREEPGAAAVEAVLDHAAISAVNLSEVQAKLVERGTAAEIAWSSLIDLDLDVVDFDLSQAKVAGDLRWLTRVQGLSLGDRACLALARVAWAARNDRRSGLGGPGGRDRNTHHPLRFGRHVAARLSVVAPREQAHTAVRITEDASCAISHRPDQGDPGGVSVMARLIQTCAAAALIPAPLGTSAAARFVGAE